jgi:hypothetical protein
MLKRNTLNICKKRETKEFGSYINNLIESNKETEYELAKDYLSQGISDYVNEPIKLLADKFLNSSNARSIYETFQLIVNRELANGASTKNAAITAIKEGIQEFKSVNSPTLGNTLQEIDTIVGDNSPFSFFTTFLEPLTERRDQEIKDTEAPFIDTLLKSLVNRVVKLSIKPEFQETPTAKEASRPESVWSWSDEYN